MEPVQDRAVDRFMDVAVSPIREGYGGRPDTSNPGTYCLSD